MENEVIIHVRTKNEGKAGFEAIAKDADTHAKAIGTSFSERISQTIKATLTEKLTGKLLSAGGPAESVGRSLGDRIGEAASTRITEKIAVRQSLLSRMLSGGGDGGDGGRGGRGGEGGAGGDAKVSVNVDKQSLLSRLFSAGKEGAMQFTEGFKSIAGNLFSGDVISIIVKAVVAGVGGLALAGPLGAAITSAVGLAFGGGAIALGIAGAFKDPRIQKAAKAMLDQVKTLFDEYSANFKGVVEDFFAPSNRGNGGLIGVLNQIRPMVQQLGKDLAPVAQHLSDGIIGFLQNAMPPLIRSVENARPLIDALADKLPKIGDHLGKFFEKITSGSKDSAVFLKDLIDVFLLLLDFTADVIRGFTMLYGTARRIFAGMVDAAADAAEAFAEAFGWVPGLGPKLDAAARKTRAFADKMNNNLHTIDRDLEIKVRFRILGQSAANAALRTATILASMGYAHGGIVGAATGGIHSGLRMVGEHGPELVELPPGTRVNSNADTERMMGGAGGDGGTVVVPVYLDGREIARAMAEPMRDLVRTQGRGSVQSLYGQPGVA